MERSPAPYAYARETADLLECSPLISPHKIERETDNLFMVDTYAPERIPNKKRQCPVCEVPPGAAHIPGCDIERCEHSGPEDYWPQLVAAGASVRRQWISCDACRSEECVRSGHAFRTHECYWCGAEAPT